ncbi:MAG: MATE family efflux transporter [Bacillota bacterium]|nr:MATE family efflux transporter [Bacillota bacterium]
MKSWLFNDRKFYKTMLLLALPIVAQNLILSSLNLVDNIIIGGLNAVAIAAVGLANQYFFLLNLVLFGICSGSSIFIAQFWGNRDIKNIKRVLGLSLITGVTASAVFTVLGLVFPRQILKLFSNDADVIKMGSDYLRIIVFSYVLSAVSFSYSFALRSIRQVKTPMYVSAVALGINTFLNYSLIYGMFGLPRLGIRGSAIGTLIARTVEMTLLLFIVYKNKLPIAASFKELFDLPGEFVKRFYKITSPVILNESVWALGVSIYSVVYAHMGTDVIASTTISSTVERIIWVIFLGLGNACAIMIGNKIGEGKEDEIFLYAKRFIVINPLSAAVMGVIVYFISPVFLMAYNISPTVLEFARKNLIVFSIFLAFRAFNFTSIVGILRSGGDTTFSLLVDLGGVWLVGVPMAFLGGMLLKLPIYYVYAMVSCEEVFKVILGLPRILSKKWINNLT